MPRAVVLCLAVLLPGCGGQTQFSGHSEVVNSIECAPFARQISGIDLYGDAASWWNQAEGRYNRSSQPTKGSVLVFRRSARLPAGHVSVVAQLMSDREIRVNQANWLHHRITTGEPVVDVSPGNDWTSVRVWWAPVNALGSTIYFTYGFIHAQRPGSRDGQVAMLTTR